MGLKQNEWIVGEVYHCLTSGGTNQFLFLWNDLGHSPSIDLKYSSFSMETRAFKGTCYADTVRVATAAEKEWLLKCIEHNQYIPYHEAMKIEFKAGDWVTGWHTDFGNRKTVPWQIARIYKGSETWYVVPVDYPDHATRLDNIRHASEKSSEENYYIIY